MTRREKVTEENIRTHSNHMTSYTSATTAAGSTSPTLDSSAAEVASLQHKNGAPSTVTRRQTDASNCISL